MSDTIRQALERLLAVIKPKYTDPDEIVAVVRAMAAARTALAAEPPGPAEADTDPVLALAAIIRQVDGSHSLGAAALAEAILSHPGVASVFQPSPPADPDALAARPLLEAVAQMGDCIGQHTVGRIMALSNRAASWLNENPPGQPVAIEPRGCPTPGACSCVQPVAPTPPADGEAEELAQWLEFEADNAQELGCATIYDHDRLRWAAGYLRQLPPGGLEAIRYCVEEDGAVIQRTSRAPESWAIRAGSSCMSTTGEWDIEPMPSDRTDKWLANHRWPSAAAAWAALQQARRQEVGQ